jgi:hypothetical protein
LIPATTAADTVIVIMHAISEVNRTGMKYRLEG